MRRAGLVLAAECLAPGCRTIDEADDEKEPDKPYKAAHGP